MSYKYFENTDCEFYPCHKTVGSGGHNCLFCYCPFHADGECPGSPKYLPNDIKDCSDCTFIHDPRNYEKIISEINRRLEIRKPLIKRIRTKIQPKGSGGL